MSVSPREKGTEGRAWTPGPLTYDVCTGDIVMDDELGARVATIDLDNCADKDQAHADGRLFAAAPDLYEAASALIACDTAENWNALRLALSRAGEVEHG